MSPEREADFDTVNYARLYGLAVNYLAEPLPISYLEAVQKSAQGNLIDSVDLQSAGFPTYVNSEDHLTVDEGAARLLEIANNGFLKPEETDSIIVPLLDTRLTKQIRIETPLLMTCHATDFKDFAQWDESHYMDGCLPMEPFDDETDAGLGWPKRLQNLPAITLKELQGETIELSKEILQYLQDKVKGSWTEEDEREGWENATLYKRNTALEPVTPPLLPTSPPRSPHIHSSPDGHLPLLSDPASLIHEDNQRAEQLVFGEDKLVPPAESISGFLTSVNNEMHIGSSDTYSLMTSIEDIEQALVLQRVKIEDHKVEVPLTPPLYLAALPNAVTLIEAVEDMLLDPISNISENRSSSVGSEAVIDKFFQEAFGEAAEQANRTIEQEQLQEADANGRVKVPIMDFSLPHPPWKKLEMLSGSSGLLKAQKSFVEDIQEESGRPVLWPGISRLLPKLQWTVFPSELAKVVLDESFGDADILSSFLHPDDDSVVSSGELTWKPPGLRILDDNKTDREDDLEPGSFDNEELQDILSLVKKRKMKLLEEDVIFAEQEKSRKRAITTEGPQNSTTMKSQRIEEVTTDRSSTRGILQEAKKDFSPARSKTRSRHVKEMILNSPFCAADALDNFLEIRAAKKYKPMSSTYFPSKPLDKGNCAALILEPSESAKIPDLPRATKIIFPIPKIDMPSTLTPYVISSTILKRRNFIRALNSLFSSAISIERDFTAHNRTAWNPNSVVRSPVPSSLDSEADLIVSPSTGVILTTLQKIKQKPLPGQKSKPAFRARLEKVSLRYERLVILVSEGCQDESTNCLAKFDTLAIAELIGFCGSLDASTVVNFVAGGEETLAKWVVAVMSQYGLRGEATIPLLQEETLWEVFLRRAGLNAFAAQAVLSQVKAPDGVEVNSLSKAGMFGITALVEMGPHERLRRFEGLLGGSRVLNRASGLLDRDWS